MVVKSRVSPTKQHTNTGGGNGVIITQAVKSEAQQTTLLSKPICAKEERNGPPSDKHI